MPNLIQVLGDEVTTFVNHDQYINRNAAIKLGQTEIVICVAVDNSVCHTQQDFLYARDNDLFPVKAYRLTRTFDR